MEIFRIEHVSEKILLELPIKQLLFARASFKLWKTILKKPLFWLKKGKLMGMIPEMLDQWRNLFQSTNPDSELNSISLQMFIKQLLQNDYHFLPSFDFRVC